MAKNKKTKPKFTKPQAKKQANKRLPRAWFYPAGISDGCTAWRFEFPKLALNYSKNSEVHSSNVIQPLFKPNKQVSEIYLNTEAVVMQRPISEDRTSIAHNYKLLQQALINQGRNPFRFVIDVDDVVHGDYMSKFNVGAEGYYDNKKFNVFKDVVKNADELQVCSPYMRDFYKEEIGVDHVTYRPNLMPKFLYDHFDIRQSLDRYDININLNKKPRILWAGSASHIDVKKLNNGVDDFSHITDFIRKTIDKYQWVFFGAVPMELQDLKGKIEFYKWVGIFNYSRIIRKLNVDVMIAPLFDNVFNRAKSNIKLTEAGALGIPCICQDLEPYKEAPMRFSTADELSDQIEILTSNEGDYEQILYDQKKVSDQYFIDDGDNMKLLMASYFTHKGSKQRKAFSPKLEEINS